jgi:hypothetical protein
MEWALSEEIDVVNLSLGTVDFEYESRFQALLESAEACGTILVSAREADGRACLPGSLPGVIGVSLDWDCPRSRYRVEETERGTIYYASGYPRSVPGLPRERNLNALVSPSPT